MRRTPGPRGGPGCRVRIAQSPGSCGAAREPLLSPTLSQTLCSDETPLALLGLGLAGSLPQIWGDSALPALPMSQPWHCWYDTFGQTCEPPGFATPSVPVTSFLLSLLQWDTETSASLCSCYHFVFSFFSPVFLPYGISFSVFSIHTTSAKILDFFSDLSLPSFLLYSH